MQFDQSGRRCWERRTISRSTAIRTKSVLSSPVPSTSAILAKVPSPNRACISSLQRFLLPTRPPSQYDATNPSLDLLGDVVGPRLDSLLIGVLQSLAHLGE